LAKWVIGPIEIDQGLLYFFLSLYEWDGIEEVRFGGTWFGRMRVFLKESVSLFLKGFPFFLPRLLKVIFIFR